MSKPNRDNLIKPFFFSEGPYCSLLHVLLQGNTPLCQAFREKFSNLLKCRIGVQLGTEPLNVQPEFSVAPTGGRSQAIDLVIDTPCTAVAIEVKVRPSSARHGQLAAQYRGLRRITPSDKQVCSLFVFPGTTTRERDVEKDLTGKDRAGCITWDEVFDCVPASLVAGGDDELLVNLLEVAKATLPCIQPVPGKTPLTDERRAFHQVMTQAVTLVKEKIAREADRFEGCTWSPKFWRSLPLDQFYGGLRSADGTRRRGQYLDISAIYVPASSAEAGDKALPHVLSVVAIAFTLEVKGGAKAYWPEFNAKRPDIIKGMPPALETRSVERDGLQVCDNLTPVVDAKGATVGGKPAAEVIAQTVYAYADAFREFLLRNVVRP